MKKKKRTVIIPIELELPDDINAVTVDRSGLICGHVSTKCVKPVIKKEGLFYEWLVLDGRVIGMINGEFGHVLNWLDTMVQYEKK